jgi:ribose transport system substrate-binding protein
MKKKILSIALAASMCAAIFAGCGSNEESSKDSSPASEVSTEDTSEKSEAPAEDSSETSENSSSDTSEGSGEAVDSTRGEGYSVTALFFSLEGEYFTFLDDLLRTGLEDLGYAYESQSSNMDPVAQIEQIENATAKGTDLIWVWALDGNAVTDACKKARENGVLVYAFAQILGDDAANISRSTDEVAVGNAVGELTVGWLDDNYPDAEDGAVKTIFIQNRNNDALAERSDNSLAAIEKDPRIEVLESPIGDGTTVNAQEIVENMVAKYGDEIDLFVSTGGEAALGVCAYLDSESCIFEDPAAIGNVSVEINEELASYMKDGLYDAAAVSGGNIAENIATQVDEIDKLIHGEIEDGFSAVDTGMCTIDNLSEFGY